MGQMEKWGMVRKMVETPDILALQGPGGTTPFNCQHFSIGAKSEQLFPLKIRKALVSIQLKTEPRDFWLGCNCLSFLPSTLASSYLMSR